MKTFILLFLITTAGPAFTMPALPGTNTTEQAISRLQTAHSNLALNVANLEHTFENQLLAARVDFTHATRNQLIWNTVAILLGFIIGYLIRGWTIEIQYRKQKHHEDKNEN